MALRTTPTRQPLVMPQKYDVSYKGPTYTYYGFQPGAQAIGAGLSSIASWAKGYAKTKILLEAQNREQKRWQQDFDLRKQNADWAKELATERLGMEYERHASELKLKRQQTEQATLDTELKNLQIEQYKTTKEHNKAFATEFQSLLAEADMSNPEEAIASLNNAKIQLKSKYQFADTSIADDFMDVQTKLLAARAAGQKAPTVIDVVRGGRIMKAMYRNGKLINVVDAGEWSEPVQDYLNKLVEAKAELNKESWEELGYAAKVQGNTLSLASIEGDQSLVDKYQKLNEIVYLHNMKTREKLIERADRADIVLEQFGISDKDQRKKLIDGYLFSDMDELRADIEVEKRSEAKMAQFHKEMVSDLRDTAGDDPEAMAAELAKAHFQIHAELAGTQAGKEMTAVLNQIEQELGIDRERIDKYLRRLAAPPVDQDDPVDREWATQWGTESMADHPDFRNAPTLGDWFLEPATPGTLGSALGGG